MIKAKYRTGRGQSEREAAWRRAKRRGGMKQRDLKRRSERQAHGNDKTMIVGVEMGEGDLFAGT